MSMFRFVAGFVIGLIGSFFLFTMLKNPFFPALIIGLIIGILFAKD